MYSDGFNPAVLEFCAWGGVIFCLMWIIGAGPMTGWLYILPPSAADTAATTAGDYSRNLLHVRLGVTETIFSTIFYTIWGMVVTFLPRKVEGDYPILFFVQVICLAVSVVVILYISFFWAGAAFRAGQTLPEITQVMNDLGWLGVLYTGAPYTAYQVALGVVILNDRSARPVYPRWSAYFNFFVAVFMSEDVMMLFFKSGPFSQNGLVCFYPPMTLFFVWILVFSYLSLKAINAEVASRAMLPATSPQPGLVGGGRASVGIS